MEPAAILEGESVLQVAAGTGLALVEFLRANPTGRNEGIDSTEEMLSRAKQKAQRSGATNYFLKTGDAYDLEYSDDSFDLVIDN